MKAFFLGLCVLVLRAEEGPEFSVTAHYSGEVILPCSTGGSSVGRVYWQKEGDEPVFMKAYCTDGSNCDKIKSSYAGRALFIGNLARGNFSLKLRDIRLDDEGSYHCVLMNNQEVSHCHHNLKVIAQYRTPEINITRGVDNVVTLTCSTSGGYPEAAVRWVNGSDNSSFPENLVVTRHVRDEHRLYSLTSVLRVKVSNDRITCQIVTNRTEDINNSVSVYPNGHGPSSIKVASGASKLSFLWSILITGASLSLK
ncbi:CD276 antigen-like isoform X2 [Carcharodon carcharias]|nr:CD276 antigen-like isoform X2 [Carcharodon carcharias]XP_041032777.1 CD276 antigen-like isoform X2 [Carcharodon carcharias]